VENITLTAKTKRTARHASLSLTPEDWTNVQLLKNFYGREGFAINCTGLFRYLLAQEVKRQGLGVEAKKGSL
jgi:hypothetical protein